MTKNLLFTTGLLLVWLVARAAGPNPEDQVDAKAAYARLGTLAGEWEADTSMGKVHVRYELIAGGSALVERETMEHMPAMETVYHLDGNRLQLTHYCVLGNQPRLEARAYDAKTGNLEFGFLSATNLASPASAHMHNASFHFVDGKHFTAAWELYENGAKKSVETAQYTRVR
jgi:hypothetical protein